MENSSTKYKVGIKSKSGTLLLFSALGKDFKDAVICYFHSHTRRLDRFNEKELTYSGNKIIDVSNLSFKNGALIKG